MAFEKYTVTPERIKRVEINLYYFSDPILDENDEPTGTFKDGYKSNVYVYVETDQGDKVVSGKLDPHISASEKQQLKDFVDSIVAKAQNLITG
jgi:hypothetical protein